MILRDLPLRQFGQVDGGHLPSRPATLIASSMFTMQKGQAVTITFAPAVCAIRTRMHADPLLLLGFVKQRQSPPPQQKERSRQRSISTRLSPGMASSTRRGSS